MAAKANKGGKRTWRSGRREGKPRLVQMTRHLIVCEGTETEPRYFEGMKHALGNQNGRKLAVVIKGSGLHTLDLLDYAEEWCRYSPEPFDNVWLAYDKDDFPSGEFDRVEQRCAALSDSSRTFHALWSNPCLKLWPLLHLRYTTAEMDARSCQAALKNALSHEDGVAYRKNLDGLFDLLEPRRHEAEANARRLVQHHEKLGSGLPSRRNPATLVYEIFDEIGTYLEKSGDA